MRGGGGKGGEEGYFGGGGVKGKGDLRSIKPGLGVMDAWCWAVNVVRRAWKGLKGASGSGC